MLFEGHNSDMGLIAKPLASHRQPRDLAIGNQGMSTRTRQAFPYTLSNLIAPDIKDSCSGEYR